MNRSYKCVCLLQGVLLLFLSVPVHAIDTYFSGFGSASLSCFSNNSADYVINDQPEGAGRTRSCDAGIDSLLGVQFDLALSESVDFGLQIIADRNADRSYTPDVTVAQLRWRLTDTTTVRLGRMPVAAFLHTENRQVRYAMPWVRPPLEVYGLVPTFSQEGVEFIYQSNLGRWHTEWHGGLTRMDFDSPIFSSRDSASIEVPGVFLNLTFEDIHTLFKVGYAYGKISITASVTEALFDALRDPLLAPFAPDAAQLADDLAIDYAPTHMLALGVRHEQNDWLTIAEFGYNSIGGYFRDKYGAYLTLGRRFGSWMPYATLAKRWSSGPDSDSRADFLQPEVDALLASTRFDTSSVALGLSREINEQATLKLQADWVKPDSNSWGMYTNHAADYNFANPDSDWLYTMSLDFVF